MGFKHSAPQLFFQRTSKKVDTKLRTCALFHHACLTISHMHTSNLYMVLFNIVLLLIWSFWHSPFGHFNTHILVILALSIWSFRYSQFGHFGTLSFGHLDTHISANGPSPLICMQEIFLNSPVAWKGLQILDEKDLDRDKEKEENGKSLVGGTERRKKCEKAPYKKTRPVLFTMKFNR